MGKREPLTTLLRLFYGFRYIFYLRHGASGSDDGGDAGVQRLFLLLIEFGARAQTLFRLVTSGFGGVTFRVGSVTFRVGGVTFRVGDDIYVDSGVVMEVCPRQCDNLVDISRRRQSVKGRRFQISHRAS